MSMYQFFYLPLQKLAKEANPFITEDQIALLFGNLTQLMDQAKRMNTLLAKVITTFTPHAKLGYIFTDNAEQLKAAFTPYVDPFDEANALFLSLRKENDRFREWLASIEFKQSDLGLESYLIMPIQRVTRYGLLLRELIHQTWQDHDDYEGLNAALQAVEEVASHVNGHKKKVIMQQKIKSIFASIISMPEITTNPEEERLYITEGPVTDLGDTIPVTHHIFLFSDLMVWTQMINKKKFMFRKMNWLKQSTAEAVEKSNAFRVITNDWVNTVFTKTKEDQNKWLAYLENDNFTPNSDSHLHHHKRPEVVFLSKAKMVEDALKRGPRKKTSSSRASQRRSGAGSSGGSSSTSKKKGRDSTGITITDDKATEKPRKTKIPRNYVTIDPKMLEEVKLAKAALEGKDSKDKKDESSSSSTLEKDKGDKNSLSSSTASAKRDSKRDSKDLVAKESKSSKDSSKSGSTKGEKGEKDKDGAEENGDGKSPRSKRLVKKKGETITPEVLAMLRSTRNMSETEQAAYLAKLQDDEELSKPPNLARLSTAGAAPPAPSSSAPSLVSDSSSESAKPAPAKAGSAAPMSLNASTGSTPLPAPVAKTAGSAPFKRPVAKSVSSAPAPSPSPKSWEGPPPPMPDLSHVHRPTGIVSTMDARNRASTPDHVSTPSPSGSLKLRTGSMSSTPGVRSSADASSSSTTATAPSSSSSPSKSNSSSSTSEQASKRASSSSKKDSNDATGDVAKRRSGSVAVSSKTIV